MEGDVGEGWGGILRGMGEGITRGGYEGVGRKKSGRVRLGEVRKVGEGGDRCERELNRRFRPRKAEQCSCGSRPYDSAPPSPASPKGKQRPWLPRSSLHEALRSRDAPTPQGNAS